MASIGERVRQLRRARGIGQEDLARKIGVSMQTISMLERGATAEPKQATLQLLARHFGVTLDFLATGKEGEASEPREPPAALVEFLATPLGATCTPAERDHLLSYVALVGPITAGALQMALSTFRYVRSNPPNAPPKTSPKGGGSGPRPRSVTPRGVAKVR